MQPSPSPQCKGPLNPVNGMQKSKPLPNTKDEECNISGLLGSKGGQGEMINYQWGRMTEEGKSASLGILFLFSLSVFFKWIFIGWDSTVNNSKSFGILSEVSSSHLFYQCLKSTDARALFHIRLNTAAFQDKHHVNLKRLGGSEKCSKIHQGEEEFLVPLHSMWLCHRPKYPEPSPGLTKIFDKILTEFCKGYSLTPYIYLQLGGLQCCNESICCDPVRLNKPGVWLRYVSTWMGD